MVQDHRFQMVDHKSRPKCQKMYSSSPLADRFLEILASTYGPGPYAPGLYGPDK